MKKIFAALMLVFSTWVFAGSDTTSMAVSATVSGTCKITTSPLPLAFGTIDPSTLAPIVASSSFAYKCTKGLTPLTILDDKGLNEIGNQFRLVSGLNFLNYNITYPATLVMGTGFGAGSSDTSILISGTIAVSDAQNAFSGTYSDTVVFTINF